MGAVGDGRGEIGGWEGGVGGREGVVEVCRVAGRVGGEGRVERVSGFGVEVPRRAPVRAVRLVPARVGELFLTRKCLQGSSRVSTPAREQWAGPGPTLRSQRELGSSTSSAAAPNASGTGVPMAERVIPETSLLALARLGWRAKRRPVEEEGEVFMKSVREEERSAVPERVPSWPAFEEIDETVSERVGAGQVRDE